MADRHPDRDRVDRVRGAVLRHDRQAAASTTSMSPTGSMAVTSSPSRCCTSSTTSRSRPASTSPIRSTAARWMP
jgi:hypothetical protein